MGQTKKPEIRDAILGSARTLFARHGYHATTLPMIARDAGVSPANVYVYFGSKIAILYAIYDPWLRGRLERLAGELKRRRTPRAKLKHLLRSFWRDIPAEDGGFANNIIQAISTVGAGEGYRPDLLRWMEGHLAALLADILPPARRRSLARGDLGHFLVMVFNGYAVHHHLDPKRPLDEGTLEAVCDLLLGPGGRAVSSVAGKAAPARRAGPARGKAGVTAR
jgi:AcrR family transcriptional regulator